MMLQMVLVRWIKVWCQDLKPLSVAVNVSFFFPFKAGARTFQAR
jgi:hypothetical protein